MWIGLGVCWSIRELSFVSNTVNMIVVDGVRFRPEDAPKVSKAEPEPKKEPVKRKPRSQGSNK